MDTISTPALTISTILLAPFWVPGLAIYGAYHGIKAGIVHGIIPGAEKIASATKKVKMANNISANPWYLDTVGVIWHGKIYFKELIWNKPAAGATLVLVDDNGNTILNTVANAQDPMFSFGSLGWIQGLRIVTMSSGTLSVFINK